MNNDQDLQLQMLMEECRNLDVDLRYHEKENHFTALVWEGWEYPHDETKALLIQEQIQRLTSQYPNLVCYCFDSFSTLVYKV